MLTEGQRRSLFVVGRVLALSLSIGALLIAATILVIQAVRPQPAKAVAVPTSFGCQADAQPVSVLVVGNSFTNDLSPMLTTVLCRSGMAPNVDITVLSTGGATLGTHVAAGEASQVPGHDVVVLQDQSETPGFGQYNGSYAASRAAVQQIGVEAGTHTRVVLLQTWGYRNGDSYNRPIYPDYETMQDRLIAGYDDYLAALLQLKGRQGQIAPAGQAWRWVRQHDPKLFARLYQEDGSHPSTTGQYLSALVLAQQISRQELPPKVWAPTGLSGHDALTLQQAARAGWSDH